MAVMLVIVITRKKAGRDQNDLQQYCTVCEEAKQKYGRNWKL